PETAISAKSSARSGKPPATQHLVAGSPCHAKTWDVRRTPAYLRCSIERIAAFCQNCSQKNDRWRRETPSPAMRQMMMKPVQRAGLAALVVPLVLPLLSSAALAGPIESACLRSGRDSASRPLCGCIQQVAD